ncbi:MAG: hypothetical protein JWN52_4667, partial [Actinomycetia bacterium]|nr:hypothetical protein [Actinomycetes bacterium]
MTRPSHRDGSAGAQGPADHCAVNLSSATTERSNLSRAHHRSRSPGTSVVTLMNRRSDQKTGLAGHHGSDDRLTWVAGRRTGNHRPAVRRARRRLADGSISISALAASSSAMPRSRFRVHPGTFSEQPPASGSNHNIRSQTAAWSCLAGGAVSTERRCPGPGNASRTMRFQTDPVWRAS